MTKVEIVKGDITIQKVDAIVNAANKSLLGGGGVDGAIHAAAGEKLLEECKTLNGCETGNAKITLGYDLPADYVIHAVGPVWKRGTALEYEHLKSCYNQSLGLANKFNLKSIAFPNISTGIYRFPKKLAAQIALRTIFEYIKKSSSIKEIVFVCFDDENFDIYNELIKEFI